MSWTPPINFINRPVVVLGAGVLGRRIACTWISAGYDVNVRDPSEEQRSQCLQYVEQNRDMYAERTSARRMGELRVFEDLETALIRSWLVIEAVPEVLKLKVATFASLDAFTPQDCILCTNSSSYKSSQMISEVSEPTKRRILNMHYYMPPKAMVVELMTDGLTEEAIFPFLVERLRETAALPYVARKESSGFIFNRLWAAVKREVLTILSEGVSVPEEIDSIWDEVFIKAKGLPCKMMDDVGLDTVAFIEQHYIDERGLGSKNTVDYLQTNYLRHGKLGTKSNVGGLYPPDHHQVKGENAATSSSPSSLFVLDVGLSAKEPSNTTGSILQLDTDGKNLKIVLSGQSMPDGIDIDRSLGRMFWTSMGIPGAQDGAVHSANLDGTDVRTLLSSGINTPKQLCLDTQDQKVYFSDREGCAVYRCNYDGSALEALVRTSSSEQPGNVMDWCVGIAISPFRGKFYWTQKGPSKGGKGRIFCGDLASPPLSSGRKPICIIDGLPEPIDLAIDEAKNTLYWTDRGEIPFGNSLNSVLLDTIAIEDQSQPPKLQILTRHFREAIGLSLDTKSNHIFVSDLSGFIYSYNITTGEKRSIFADSHRALTGIAVL
ncbi:hypothetical protein IL306_001219 [Fusarium sp. DS 682]|nr:hypothetical protein IL306_001219 [Fusarium sp. DS 682]